MDIQNKVQSSIRAVTVLHTPYVMKGPGSTLIGLVPDILNHMQTHLNVTFHLYLTPDGKYGSRDANGTWDGMMNELVKRRDGDTSGADMAASPMLITAERRKSVSFLHPFKHGGLVGLMRKPHLDYHQRHPLDSIYINVMQPLATDVWITIVVACLSVATGLWLLNYFNPYEWGGRYNIGRATEAASESFNFSGSLWFTFTTLQWQGFDRMPRSIASKFLSIFWFAFVTLAITTYTASLVNHLFWASTKQGNLMKTPFIDLAHLAKAHEEFGYNYGVEATGPAYTYLLYMATGQEYGLMQKYWMNEGKKNLVRDTSHGLLQAREGKFVFITERMTAEFFVNQQPCDLMMIDKVSSTKMGAII